jgi:transposase-like protein
MGNATKKPTTLQQAILYFADQDNCLNTLIKLRWPDGVVVCPTCGRKDVVFLKNQRKWQCKTVHHHRQFSIKVGTIFEDSPIKLDKWLVAIWMISNCKNGVSSYEIGRALGITQKSAWFMLHRIRLAMQARSLMKLGGKGVPVEVDETFIGGASRFMHHKKRNRVIVNNRMRDKVAVFGMLERGGEVRVNVVPSRRRQALHSEIKAHVKAGSAIYSDNLMSYQGLKGHDYQHQVIDHAEKYVDGQVHTNGLENFWSLLKRGLKGTYISVEPFHLFRYLDEQVFRYNFRKLPHDGARFEHVASQILGKRLTFAEVTGKTNTTCNN